jgi:perosamine synthetase
VALSPWCAALMGRWDYDTIRRRRRANFALLREALAGSAVPLMDALPDEACPLFFPILVADKHRAARALWARGVDAVEFWNQGDPETPSFADTQFLRDHVLELPIHQDLSSRQVEYVADQVRAASIPRVHAQEGALP